MSARTAEQGRPRSCTRSPRVVAGVTLALALLTAGAVAGPRTAAAEPALELALTGDGGSEGGGGPRAPREVVDGPRLSALLAEIARARKAVTTLRADFRQERRLSLLATSVVSNGELVFVAPDRLRWDLAPPDDVVYFIGPEGLSYKTRSSSATVPAEGASVARALGDVRALLGGDLSALADRYALSATRGAADVELAGTAKDPKASVRAFTLVLDRSLVIPLRARLLEGKSDGIELQFANVVLNAPVDPARMRP